MQRASAVQLLFSGALIFFGACPGILAADSNLQSSFRSMPRTSATATQNPDILERKALIDASAIYWLQLQDNPENSSSLNKLLKLSVEAHQRHPHNPLICLELSKAYLAKHDYQNAKGQLELAKLLWMGALPKNDTYVLERAVGFAPLFESTKLEPNSSTKGDTTVQRYLLNMRHLLESYWKPSKRSLLLVTVVSTALNKSGLPIDIKTASSSGFLDEDATARAALCQLRLDEPPQELQSRPLQIEFLSDWRQAVVRIDLLPP